MRRGLSSEPLSVILWCFLFVFIMAGVALAQPAEPVKTGPPGFVKKLAADAANQGDVAPVPGPPPEFAAKEPLDTSGKAAPVEAGAPGTDKKEEKKAWFTKHVIESSLIIHYKKGGFIMYFILACSIGGLYIFLERSYSLRRKRMLPPKFLEEILDKIPEGGLDLMEERKIVKSLIDLCMEKDIPLARSLRSGLLVHTEGIAGAKAAIVSNNDREGALLTKGVPILALFSNIAPLLGLLGTVTGMIKAFDMLSAAGAGKPEVVAAGISEALTTTAGGLFVGIPLLLLTNIAQGKVDNILLDIEEFTLEVIERLIYREAVESG